MSSAGFRAESAQPATSVIKAHGHARMHFWMLCATLCWAANIVAGKYALRGFGSLALAQLRLAGAALVLLILFFLWPSRPHLRLTPRQWIFIAWTALFGITVNQYFFITGLSRSSVAHTGLIVALGPVMVLALSCLMRLEILTWLKLVGMLISFVGVGILTLGQNAQSNGATLHGDLFLLAGSAVFAYYTVLVKEVSEQLDSITLNTLIFGMGAVMLLPLGGRAALAVRWGTLPAASWWGLAFMVVFGSVTAYLLFAFALTELTAARVAAFSYLQPVIAAILAVWLLGESLTWRIASSGALILFGVYLTERERGEETPAPKISAHVV